VAGIQTIVLRDDPNSDGLYTIMLRIPANRRIAAHTHPDGRGATVISGTWFIGYGDAFSPVELKGLPPGSFYTEPAGRTHFAETGGERWWCRLPASGLLPRNTSIPSPIRGKTAPNQIGRRTRKWDSWHLR
jgi:hypothetical protein